jgi:hypothetical protein
MTLLAATQGTPDRVWALTSLLAQFPDGLTRDEIAGWLNPRFSNAAGATAQSQGTAVEQSITAAQGLGLVDGRDRYVLSVPPMADYDDFMDVVHAYLSRLPGEEANALILEGFAWAVLKVEQDGAFGALSALGNKALADQINAALPPRAGDSADRRFNEFKPPFWRRWLHALDLVSDLGRRELYPYITERLWRVLDASQLPKGVEVPSSDVIAAIAQAMPYLDGGRIWTATAARMGFTPPPRLSRVLSVGLRDLHDEGKIELKGLGDDTGLTRLARDPRHRVQSIGAVVIRAGASDA